MAFYTNLYRISHKFIIKTRFLVKPELLTSYSLVLYLRFLRKCTTFDERCRVRIIALCFEKHNS